MEYLVEQLVEVAGGVAPDLVVRVDGASLIVETAVGRVAVTWFVRASVTPSIAMRLTTENDGPGLVIADLVDSGAKRMLEAAGWSYWDRRGHLRWWLPEVGLMLNDTTVGSFVTGADGPDPLRPVTGTGGISVALGLLVSPHDPLGVREIARMAGMSPSTISRARQHLVDAGLVESDGTPLVPELFWALSDAWVVKPVPVSARPVGDGWAVAGEAVAALNTGRRCWVTGSASTVRNAGSSIRTG